MNPVRSEDGKINALPSFLDQAFKVNYEKE